MYATHYAVPLRSVYASGVVDVVVVVVLSVEFNRQAAQMTRRCGTLMR